MRSLVRFVLVGSLALNFACGEDLSRAEAKQLITDHLGLPTARTEKIHFFYSKRLWSDPVVGFGTVTVCIDEGPKYSSAEGQLADWKSKGLIEVIEESGRSGNCNWVRAAVGMPEDVSKRYHVKTLVQASYYEVPLYDLSFGEITGIITRPEQRTAEVEYTLKPANITPFASADVASQTTSHKMTFTLYDDGWRPRRD